jgi:hypothetical protein
VKHSEFWQVVEETFGPVYGRSLVEDLVLTSLGGRTAAQAVREGDDPQRVWDAVCVEMELGEAARWRHRGEEKKRR